MVGVTLRAVVRATHACWIVHKQKNDIERQTYKDTDRLDSAKKRKKKLDRLFLDFDVGVVEDAILRMSV